MRALLILLALGATAAAEPLYAPASRVAHLRASLEALTKLGKEGRRAFELELHTAVRAKCRVTTTRPGASCMIEVGRRLCGAKADRAACLAAADVVLTNQHAETDLIDDQTRMKLLRGSSDFHAAVVGALEARYALLAAELALVPQAADRAAQIDGFCTTRDREVHSCAAGEQACIPSVAYQRCAAGLAWYVVTEEDRR